MSITLALNDVQAIMKSIQDKIHDTTINLDDAIKYNKELQKRSKRRSPLLIDQLSSLKNMKRLLGEIVE